MLPSLGVQSGRLGCEGEVGPRQSDTAPLPLPTCPPPQAVSANFTGTQNLALSQVPALLSSSPRHSPKPGKSLLPTTPGFTWPG